MCFLEHQTQNRLFLGLDFAYIACWSFIKWWKPVEICCYFVNSNLCTTTIHFCRYGWLVGKLLCAFWFPSPRNDDFWPEIRLIGDLKTQKMINNLYSFWYILPGWSLTKSILAFWISVKFAIKRYTIWLLLNSFDFPHFHDFSRQKLMPILGYTSKNNPNSLSLALIGPLPPLRKLY